MLFQFQLYRANEDSNALSPILDSKILLYKTDLGRLVKREPISRPTNLQLVSSTRRITLARRTRNPIPTTDGRAAKASAHHQQLGLLNHT